MIILKANVKCKLESIIVNNDFRYVYAYKKNMFPQMKYFLVLKILQNHFNAFATIQTSSIIIKCLIKKTQFIAFVYHLNYRK